jgi:hypothetical protein
MCPSRPLFGRLDDAPRVNNGGGCQVGSSTHLVQPIFTKLFSIMCICQPFGSRLLLTDWFVPGIFHVASISAKAGIFLCLAMTANV